MRIALLGGAGGMGGAFGARLHQAGHDVTLIDVSRPAVETINRDGLVVETKTGEKTIHKVPAVTSPAGLGPVDLLINFVKCYHTESAITSALPLLGPKSVVLSLQNGWGNAPVIARVAGADRVLLGVTYHSATVIAPGHILHAGQGPTFLGALEGGSERAQEIAAVLNGAGLEVVVPADVRKEIWGKLLLNICTLPTSSLLRFGSIELVQQEGTLSLMRALLEEGAAVAKAQGIAVDVDERWQTITALLGRVGMSKSSMLQDVEKGRRTEIDVISGAIVAEGKARGIPTPHNQTMLWLVKALEGSFASRQAS